MLLRSGTLSLFATQCGTLAYFRYSRINPSTPGEISAILIFLVPFYGTLATTATTCLPMCIILFDTRIQCNHCNHHAVPLSVHNQFYVTLATTTTTATKGVPVRKCLCIPLATTATRGSGSLYISQPLQPRVCLYVYVYVTLATTATTATKGLPARICLCYSCNHCNHCNQGSACTYMSMLLLQPLQPLPPEGLPVRICLCHCRNPCNYCNHCNQGSACTYMSVTLATTATKGLPVDMSLCHSRNHYNQLSACTCMSLDAIKSRTFLYYSN